jgi:hypothetical protein
MTSPLLRAVLENDDSFDDPSEDLLFEILSDIEAGDALWVIVERVDDATGQTYAQVLRDHDGTYIVERRLGNEATHESTRAPDMKEAHELLTRWAFAL